tara:strand:+ start:343 stop:720 length:378 start_codon:yes stop_codon:yes gene_type:complete
MPKKTTKKAIASKKSKLNDLDQTHGKQDSAPRTLDQIWGDTGLWKYNTTDEKEYTKQLEEMSMVDIQNHASEMGIIPTPNRNNLVKKLISEFNKHTSQYLPINVKSEKEDSGISAEAAKILKEGQ